jgi:hypothetical protein
MTIPMPMQIQILMPMAKMEAEDWAVEEETQIQMAKEQQEIIMDTKMMKATETMEKGTAISLSIILFC